MGSPPSSSRLQQMLQMAVQSVQWTYSLYWQFCPQQGVLVWGDGYYNGAIKTRKTVQAIEVSAEETSLQRSQQLKELYDSLSAGETNQPARRPCAALSPEDLTESEWFYLMCVSFSFPPGLGLPGKALASQQHVWLTRANEADSKVFSRAILAKSARIQTVVCIPLEDGVLELGTTEKVEEDTGLIQHAKSFFTDYLHHHPKPAHSEHSTSKPTTSNDRPLYNSQPPNIMYQVKVDPHGSNSNQEDEDDEEEEEDNDEDDDDDDEAQVGSDSETEIGRYNAENLAQLIPPSLAVAEPSELMQFEMSEDIRLGSPDDCSNDMDPDHLLAVDHITSIHSDHQHWDNSYQAWPVLHEDFNNDNPKTSGNSQIQELSEEDAHYSQTVSVILQQNSIQWVDSVFYDYLDHSQQSAFSKWNCGSDHVLPILSQGASQWLLKYILFTVPFLHSKYKDENSPNSRDGGSRFRKDTPQNELSANHVLAERRRREKLNERFIILRSLVPFVTKMDKASILGDTIEYVKQLRRHIQDLESQNRQESNQRSNATETHKSMNLKDRTIETGSGSPQLDTTHLHRDDRSRVVGLNNKKLKMQDGGTGKAKATITMAPPGTNLQVSIIEADALLELQCPYREGLLFKIMQILHELRLEITSINSSSTNGTFAAELRAKVKENVHGKRTSIVEVKKAIHQIFSQY